MTGTLPEDNRLLANRHHRFGWCALFVFISFGMALDAFHGFKIGSYLDPSIDSPRALQDVDSYNNIRRFLWMPVSYTHLRANETLRYLVCRLLL